MMKDTDGWRRQAGADFGLRTTKLKPRRNLLKTACNLKPLLIRVSEMILEPLSDSA